MGDYNGIGPEIVVKSLDKLDLQSSIPVWVGISNVFETVAKHIGSSHRYSIVQHIDEVEPGQINILEINSPHSLNTKIEYGLVTADAGRASMAAIDQCIRLCLDQACQAMVTAPISKEAVNKAGYSIPGHTEYLMGKTDSKDVMMILAGDVFKIALSTIHTPVKNISAEISFEKLIKQIQMIHQTMKNDFGIDDPSIAVLGLNPHAGDGGVIGNEEIEVIVPAIEYTTNKGFKISGPFPADGYFASRKYNKYDITFAMYHDQGLIPFKMSSFGGGGVNYTAGLPIIRTSPDHGTAFDIAGKNKADERSFIQAYQLAVKMATNRFL